MKNFQNILCPVDLSSNSLQSIDVASTLAATYGAKMYIVFIAPPPLPLEAQYADGDLEKHLAHCRAQLEKVQPSNDDVEFERIFEQGDPVNKVVELAEEYNCDLIVLSSHGRSGIYRLLMGSVAEGITRHSPCPVLTIRHDQSKSETAAKQQSV